MKKNKAWILIACIILVGVIGVIFVNSKENDEKQVEEEQLKGTWNEQHTVYTNANDAKMNQEEYDSLLELVEDAETIDELTQEMVDGAFSVGIKINDQMYWSDLEGHAHEVPAEFQEVGKISGLAEFSYRIEDQLKEFEATANMRIVAEEGKAIYSSEKHPETVIIQGSDDIYYAFVLEGKETTVEAIHGSH